MFIIELTYTADLARIDAAMRAHMQFINAHYASGHFVKICGGTSSPPHPPDALARGGPTIPAPLARLTRCARSRPQQDPFVMKGLATARVIEFRGSQRADDVAARMERG